MYMTTISVSEARRTLPHQLDLVQRGEEIEISRYGQVVAVLVPPKPRRNAAAEAAIERSKDIGRRLAEARQRPLRPGTISIERAEEMIAAIRADRDAE